MKNEQKKQAKEAIRQLFVACKKGDIKTVERLLSENIEIDGIDNKKTMETALYEATLAGWTEIMELLVKSGANVNHQNRWGATPLHKICEAEFDSAETVKKLIELGADVNTLNIAKHSPIFSACRELNKKSVEVLLSTQMVDTSIIGLYDKQTLLEHTENYKNAPSYKDNTAERKIYSEIHSMLEAYIKEKKFLNSLMKIDIEQTFSI